MTKHKTATDVVMEAINTGRDVADVLHEALDEIAGERPAWATDGFLRFNDDGSGFWYERPVGRGYQISGVGRDVGVMLDDESVPFCLVWSKENATRGLPTQYIDQRDMSGMSFASPDAMRRYARVLLEVADGAERLQAGN